MERQAEQDKKGPTWLAVMARVLCFIALWFALSGFRLADFPAALIAIVAATLVSLRLLPAGHARPSALALGRLALRFSRQSLAAGLDVAWRALDPRMRLRPGLVIYETRLPQGPSRSAFLTLMSLLPGSLPAWQDEDGKITIHCLDVDQPVAAQMAEEEKLFVRALGVSAADD